MGHHDSLSIKTHEQFWGTLVYKGKAVQQCIFVVRDLKTNLLGLPAITALGLSSRIDATETDAPIAAADEIPSSIKARFHQYSVDSETSGRIMRFI